MPNQKLKYQKNKISLLFIRVILFISVFAFSGFYGNSHLEFQESTPSELLLSKKEKLNKNKRSISVKKAMHLSIVQSSPTLLSIQKFSLINFNQLLKTKFKTQSRKILSYDSTINIFQTITLLSSSLDDIPASQIG